MSQYTSNTAVSCARCSTVPTPSSLCIRRSLVTEMHPRKQEMECPRLRSENRICISSRDYRVEDEIRTIVVIRGAACSDVYRTVVQSASTLILFDPLHLTLRIFAPAESRPMGFLQEINQEIRKELRTEGFNCSCELLILLSIPFLRKCAFTRVQSLDSPLVRRENVV